MKKLFSLSLLLFVLFQLLPPKSSKATHIIGGELIYECKSGAPTNVYVFTFNWYRDCTDVNNAPFDSVVYLTIYDTLENWIASVPMLLPPTDTLDNETYAECFFAPPTVCVENAIYRGAYTFGPAFDPGGYLISFQRCCRNDDIDNLVAPLSTGASWYVTIPDTSVFCNRSAYFKNYPPTIICLDRQMRYDNSAIDPDGDSLVYYICEPTEFNISKQYRVRSR